jgi:hypothetical protein
MVLQKYSKKCILKIVLGRSHIGTIGAKMLIKTAQWRLLQVAPRARALPAIP